MRYLRARRTGFTLIELLVVIAIITLLVAIALPVFSRAREKARQTACMANLHHIAMSLRLYRMDEGAYPGPYDPVTGRGGLNALYPVYLDSRRALICPSDPVKSGRDYLAKQVNVGGAVITYQQLLERSGNMYAFDWTSPDFFSQHYSSYNDLYNWIGYVRQAGSYGLCGLGTHDLRIGDSLAFWYEWYRWDPEDRLNIGSNFWTVDQYLAWHLAQQVYWAGYGPSSFNPEDPARLKDSLGRSLWDPFFYTRDLTRINYGIYSSVFPGLINRNAPDNTIVTRCPYHRAQTMVRVRTGGSPPSGREEAGGPPARQAVRMQEAESAQDIVLWLDGTCSLVPGLGYDWARQPPYSR
jgi:prepilin-type N-terminal cleavage/methylation domain-containing protein